MDHPLGITNPSKRVQVAFKKPRPSFIFHHHRCQTFLTFHLIAISTTTASNNARLTILPPPIATNPKLPPPNPRVPAQDSLATLAPQRQHPWLCLHVFQQRHPPATTQFHEQRERRDKNPTLHIRRSRVGTGTAALLETRHQARADC
jgi:hypothetical protein